MLKKPKSHPRKTASALPPGSRPKNAILEARILFRETLKHPGGKNDDDEEVEGNHVLSVFELGWRVWLPWNLHATYELWKKSRVPLWEKLEKVLDLLQEEEEFDFENIDANGIPARRFHSSPAWVRRSVRIFLFAYWDPLLDFLPSAKSVLLAFRWLIVLVPIALFVAASMWLTTSLLQNLEYLPGDCFIETLPKKFEIKSGITRMVTGRYTIRRLYEPSSERAGGMVIQECSVAVECKNVNSGRGDTDGDDTCESFKMWAWKDPIECFYHQDDYFGDQKRELYCLGRPSNLQQELFGTGVSAVGVMITGLLVVIVLWRKREHRRYLLELELQANREKEQSAQVLLDRVKREEEDANRQAEKNRVNEVDVHEGDDHNTRRSSTMIDLESGSIRA